MDSLRAARYPFLSEASEFAEANSEGIEKLLSSETYADARERGLARVMGALDNHTIPENSLSGEYNRLMEVLSYPYARILVSCVGDRLLHAKVRRVTGGRSVTPSQAIYLRRALLQGISASGAGG